MDDFAGLARALRERDVRFAVIGVWGANFFASDLFFPPDPGNLIRAWDACDASGFALWAGDEPLDVPHDRVIADAVVARRALTRATHGELAVDLTLVMGGFDFEQVWTERRTFVVEGVEIPVARLAHIVEAESGGRPRERSPVSRHPRRGAAAVAGPAEVALPFF